MSVTTSAEHQAILEMRPWSKLVTGKRSTRLTGVKNACFIHPMWRTRTPTAAMAKEEPKAVEAQISLFFRPTRLPLKSIR